MTPQTDFDRQSGQYPVFIVPCLWVRACVCLVCECVRVSVCVFAMELLGSGGGGGGDIGVLSSIKRLSETTGLTNPLALG